MGEKGANEGAKENKVKKEKESRMMGKKGKRKGK